MGLVLLDSLLVALIPSFWCLLALSSESKNVLLLSLPLAGFLVPVVGFLGHFLLLLEPSGLAFAHFWIAPGPSWALLGRSRPLLGPSWLCLAALGLLLAALGLLLAALGCSWLALGHSWTSLGSLLGRSWPLLGCSWAPKMPQVERQDGPGLPKYVKSVFYKNHWNSLGKPTILPSRRVSERAKMPPRWPLGRSCRLMSRS